MKNIRGFREHWTTNILTMNVNEATLPAVQAATTKILTTNLLNHEYFDLPAIRYVL